MLLDHMDEENSDKCKEECKTKRLNLTRHSSVCNRKANLLLTLATHLINAEQMTCQADGILDVRQLRFSAPLQCCTEVGEVIGQAVLKQVNQ